MGGGAGGLMGWRAEGEINLKQYSGNSIHYFYPGGSSLS